MNYIKGRIIIIFLLLQILNAHAQEYLIDAQLIRSENGLANLLTTAVFKDTSGFMWFGTGYGLNRFDGYKFKLYTKEKSNLTRNNPINHLTQDDNGLIWIYYDGNPYPFPQGLSVGDLDIFNPRTETVLSFDNFFKGKAPFKKEDICISFINDPKKRFWITTTNGDLYLYKNSVFDKIFSSQYGAIQFITIDEKDNIWLGYKRKIIKINLKGKELVDYEFSNSVSGLWIERNGKISVSTSIRDKSKSTNTYNVHQHKFWIKGNHTSAKFKEFHFNKNGKNLAIESRGYAFIQQSVNGFWYIKSGNELNAFDKNGNWLANINQLVQNNYRTDVLSFYSDDKYDWFSSPVGVCKVSIKPNRFKLIHSYKDEFSDTRGITEDEKGNIYFSNRHLHKWSPQTQTITQLSKENATASLIYNQNKLWTGIYGGNTLGYKFDLSSKETTYFSLENTNHLVYATLQQGEFNYLLGLGKGLLQLDVKNDTITPFFKYNEFDILKNSSIYHLVEHRDTIWMASSVGVFQIKKGQGIIRKFDTTTGDLPFNDIRFIHIDDEDVFWLGTKGGGIIRWLPNLNNPKKSKSQYQQITVEEGLSNDYIYAIYEDKYNQLWISSDRGLMCMNKSDLSIRTFLEKDGLPHNEFNSNSYYQSKDSTIYFGGLGGLISFRPEDFEYNIQDTIPFRFIGFYIQEANQQGLTDKTLLLNETKKITINPSDEFFELQFALLDFDNPEQHHYAYMIEGYSDKWNYIDENFIRLTGLPYGTYKLRIKAQNINNVWSKQELVLTVVMKPPFYLTSFFMFSMIGLVLLILWMYFKYRTIQLKNRAVHLENIVKVRTAQIESDKEIIQRQAKELKQLDKAKTRFFSNITHEFRTPLTLIIGPIDQLIRQTTNTISKKQLIGVQKNAQHLLELINQMLDVSKIESGQMKKELTHGDIVAYTQELTNRFRPLANKKNIRIGLVSNKIIWNIHFDKDKWNKILYNLLSNAIKFTAENGAVQITLMHKTTPTENIFLEVKDTGRGIHQKELEHIFDRFYQTTDSEKYQDAGTGIGLSLVKELVQLLNGSITAFSEVGKGTTFQISLPVEKITEKISSTLMTFNDIHLPIVDNIPETKTKTIQHSQEPLQLLIIDDNEEIRAYIRSCIPSKNYEIHEAKDGIEGIQLAQKIIPDLIISDVMMPKKNGYEVTHAIRSDIKTSHIPIILLTAKTALESRLEGLSRGADAYLTKPFSPEELTLRIQKLIENRQLLQQRYSNIAQSIANTSIKHIQQEDDFIIDLKVFIKNNLDSSDKLTGEGLSKEFAMSRMQLYRKVKALTNQSLSEIVKGIKMETAMSLIKERKLTLAQIAYQTGFSSPSHFSKTFKKVYGKSPSEV